jgi:hypothetical protein
MIDRHPIGGRTVMSCKDGHGANALSGDSAADGVHLVLTLRPH